MALPEIVLPAWAGKIGGKLPGRPPRFALVFALNTMLKRGLLPADMSLFDGRTFEIDVFRFRPMKRSKSKFSCLRLHRFSRRIWDVS